MGEERDAAAVGYLGDAADSADELEQEPIEQDDIGRHVEGEQDDEPAGQEMRDWGT